MGLWGQGVHGAVTVPMTPPDCYGHFTVTFYITYLGQDHFFCWTYHTSYTYDAPCQPNPYFYGYSIGGERP